MNISLQITKLVCGCLLMSLALSAVATEQRSKPCDRMDMSTILSPDGAWTIRQYGETCDLGLSASAAVVIELDRADSAASRQVILGISMPPKKSAWPRLAWVSPKKVMIDLPSSAEIGLQMAHYQGVDIEVRFCPRDPAVRAGWLEYRAAYRQWITDTTAWTEMKKRQPESTAPKPVRPTPPSTGTDLTCSE